MPREQIFRRGALSRCSRGPAAVAEGSQGTYYHAKPCHGAGRLTHVFSRRCRQCHRRDTAIMRIVSPEPLLPGASLMHDGHVRDDVHG